MPWYVYELAPIDFNWEHLPTVEATAIALAGHDAQAAVRKTNVAGMESDQFLSLWRSAQDAALSAGWGGDHRNDPVVMWLPGDSEFVPGFVLKQDNNGTTYVVSPLPMPHFES